ISPMRETARANLDKVVPDAHLLARQFASRGGDARAMGILLSVLGSLALAITCVGIFATISYTASLRRQEISIRMALGADRRSVRLLVLKQFAWPMSLGLLVGVAIAIPVGLLFSGVPLLVNPFDPLVLLGAASVMAVVSGAAAMLPAVRAARRDVFYVLLTERQF